LATAKAPYGKPVLKILARTIGARRTSCHPRQAPAFARVTGGGAGLTGGCAGL